ncbi:class I glutamine amidotransferase-like protein [Polyplosphaeria fusca]|uniref:Class I glutamine amidotransferase-like protein n=1 Tax=Polyplosphaeria fusca TaxID=682080 RepID=A0A9P4V172_9PLEO|nr:class I glutamine amidotransferase-like protein [Polyplosphaeria fusca]
MAPLRIGVLIVTPIQLLDIAPIDLFSMLKRDYFEACKFPPPLLDISIPTKDLEIIYIGASGPNTHAETTANLSLQINAGLDDARVAPGALDILLIPGPPPRTKPEEEVLDFVRSHVKAGVELLTICTGIWVAGYAGVLDGKRATGSRGVMDMLQKDFPAVKWEDKRYVHDGKLWTAGGITNGMDMVAAYMRHRWADNPRLPETVLAMAEVMDRGESYETGKVRFTAWWVVHILRSWIGGLMKSKKAV